jgi:hypothetical protein
MWTWQWKFTLHKNKPFLDPLKKNVTRSRPGVHKSWAQGRPDDCVQWRLVFVGPQYGICFMSPFWRLEFWKICGPLLYGTAQFLIIFLYVLRHRQEGKSTAYLKLALCEAVGWITLIRDSVQWRVLRTQLWSIRFQKTVKNCFVRSGVSSGKTLEDCLLLGQCFPTLVRGRSPGDMWKILEFLFNN